MNVLTHHNDNARTGANLNETVLNVASVSSKRFGRLFERKVNGAVYAQPLIARVNVSNKVRNVLYVATMRNKVYAFDSDDPAASAPLWGPVTLGTPGTPDSYIHLPDNTIGGGQSYKDVEWEIGVLGTPVIDLGRNALYVVAATKEGNDFHHKLHKLDLGSGALTSSQPIAATQGNARFSSEKNSQRAGLVLANGRVYAAFASYADADAEGRPEVHGWVIAFDPDKLVQTAVFCTTPTGGQCPRTALGGIWMAGEAPAVDDAGNLYVTTGNGSFGPEPRNPTDFSTCFVKLSPSLKVVDYFSPHNNEDLGQYVRVNNPICRAKGWPCPGVDLLFYHQNCWKGNDCDLGSAGVLLIPNSDLLVGGGKESKFYLLHRDKMGGFIPCDNPQIGCDPQIAQWFIVTRPHGDAYCNPPKGFKHIHGTPTVWTGPMGTWVYVWPESEELRAYRLGPNNRFTVDADHNGVWAAKGQFRTDGMPGGFLSVSANGATEGSGIVWANHPWKEDTDTVGVVEGVLFAYDASNLRELWNSRINRARDDFGNFAKFCPPTVANGKVYLPTMGGLHRKVRFPNDTALGGVALATLDDLLVIGWTDSNSRNLTIRWSNDGIGWSGKLTSAESSSVAPALASGLDRGRLFMAWTGNDTGRHLNVQTAYYPIWNWFNKVTLPENSTHAPALAFGNGRLFLAWTGTDTDGHLNVMSSVDGVHWERKVTLDELSGSGPSLAFFGGTLFLLWCGRDANKSLNLRPSVNGVVWGTKKTFNENSQSAPAMALDDDTPFLCWAGRDTRHLHQMTPRDGNPQHFTDMRTFRDRSFDAPALAGFRHRMYAGWTDTDGRPNIAVLSLGGVSVYGLLH